MNRFRRIQAILRDVVDLPLEERAAALDRACGADDALRDEVQSLLAREGDLPAVLVTRGAEKALGLEAAPSSAAAAEDPDATFVQAPAGPFRVPGYRIVRRLGAGGMGVVWEAEQLEPRRPVAIKVIRGVGTVSELDVQLFQREAQALARLRHPSIAAIYGAGRTEDGQHFFAMELVRGRPLDDFVKQLPLADPHARANQRARIEIFLKIVDAIAYAHGRGVLHRDLKPSNILVDARATVHESPRRRSASSGSMGVEIKILDFGLARITDGEQSSVVTRPGQVQGTLPYMSPEQVRGNPDQIDTRSDVYALGVILHELLADTLPIDVLDTPLHEAARRICESPPRRAGEIRRELRGDLETILGKALEKEPARRYQSAAALGEDLERYLIDEPILARPASATYQLGKLIARHRLPFAFAGSLVVLLVAFSIVMSVMFRQQSVERGRAERAAMKSEAVSRFLHDLLLSATPDETRGREVTVREVLESSIRELEANPPADQEVLGELRATLGEVLLALGDFESAREQLRQSLPLLEESLGPGNPLVRNTKGWLAAALHEAGDFERAEEVYREVLDAQRRAGDVQGGVIGATIRDWGLTPYRLGRRDEAEIALREAADVMRGSAGASPDEVATTLNHLAVVLSGAQEWKEAELALREALALRLEAHGALSHGVLETRQNIASVLRHQGRMEESLEMARQVRETGRELWPEGHPHLARYLREQASIYRDVEDYGAAAGLLAEALEMERRLLPPDHPDVAATLHNLAYTHRQMGDLEAAEREYQQALIIRRRCFDGDHPDVAVTANNLAWVHRLRSNPGEAASLFEECVGMYRRLYGSDPRVSSALTGLGMSLLDLGRAAEAEGLLQEACEIRRGAYGETHWRTAQTASALAGCLVRLGRIAEAESLLATALPVIRQSTSAPPELLPESLLHLALLLEAKGQASAAADARREARDTVRD